jgi:hypothetical protein
MKRYLIFAGLDYYPLAGWLDFQASFEDLGEAWARASDLVGEHVNRLGDVADWSQVVDSDSGKILFEFDDDGEAENRKVEPGSTFQD